MRYILLFSLLGLLVACQKKDRHETIAKELCNCMKPLAEQYNRAVQLSDSGRTAELEQLIMDLEVAAEESEACAERLEEQYGDLENEKEAVEAAMEKACPDIVTMINDLESEME